MVLRNYSNVKDVFFLALFVVCIYLVYEDKGMQTLEQPQAKFRSKQIIVYNRVSSLNTIKHFYFRYQKRLRQH